MAKIVSRKITVDPPVSGDVVNCKLYIGASPLDYDSSSWDLGMDITDRELFPVVGEMDGVYDIGVSFVDAVGNESDITTIVTDYPLDFIPPQPPTGGIIS